MIATVISLIFGPSRSHPAGPRPLRPSRGPSAHLREAFREIGCAAATGSKPSRISISTSSVCMCYVAASAVSAVDAAPVTRPSVDTSVQCANEGSTKRISERSGLTTHRPQLRSSANFVPGIGHDAAMI